MLHFRLGAFPPSMFILSAINIEDTVLGREKWQPWLWSDVCYFSQTKLMDIHA